MATTIKLKNSVTTTATPSTLVQGEAAVNITDKKVWVGDASSTPVQILGAGATVAGTTGTFTGNVSVAGTFSANGGATLGDASGDALTINSSAVSIPNGLNFDSNTLVIDATNNYVGVGTSSPVVKLDVNGSFYVGYTASSQEIAVYNGDATNRQRIRLVMSGTDGVIDARRAAGTVPNMLFQIDGTERMRITSAGNVGIGTSSPASKFEVYGANGSGAITANITGGTSAGDYGILGIRNGTTTKGRLVADASVDTFRFDTAGGASTAMTFLTGSSYTERMRLDSSGNLGLGVTPSAWSLGKALEVGTLAGNSFFGYQGETHITNNANYNSGWKYTNTATSARYQMSSGQHSWWTAASGTAGNAITFTQAMTLDASGNLGVGTTSPATKLQVNASSGYVESRVSSGTNDVGLAIDGSTAYLAVFDAIPLTFQTNNTERMRIDSSGNLLVGLTSATSGGGVLQVSNGITFPATQSASSNANTLDDYEEGTFTPTITGSTTAGTGTYGSQEGYYTKIGNVVTVAIYILVSAHTGTGNVRISGLPFSATGGSGGVAIGRLSGLALTAGYVATMYTSGTNIVIEQYPTGGGSSIAVPMDEVWSTNITVTYRV